MTRTESQRQIDYNTSTYTIQGNFAIQSRERQQIESFGEQAIQD
jgi:hypothetical protein